VILLQFLRDESRVKRASLHEPEIRQYMITGEGIVLGDAF